MHDDDDDDDDGAVTGAKLPKLVAFSIHCAGGEPARVRPINSALFTVTEPIALWLTDRPRGDRLQAPFRKLVISLIDEATWSRGTQATNVLGIGEVTLPVSDAELRERVTDHRWVLGLVRRGLACLAGGPSRRYPEDLRWRSPELEAFVDELIERPLPLVHVFARMRRLDRMTGTTCVPWVAVRPGETAVGVRFESAQGRRDVTVHAEPKPFMVTTMLSDWGPLRKAAIRGREYVLMDYNGNVLASVPIP
jgi:hypothetical protein